MAATVISGLEGNICRPGGFYSDGTFHVQGKGPPCPSAGADLTRSTWACPGTTDDKDMLYIDCSIGEKSGPKECVFIDNFSNVNGRKDAFFVPLNTPAEWLAFRNKANTPTGVEIHVGCPRDEGYKDADGNVFSLPNMRVPPLGNKDPEAGKLPGQISISNSECSADFVCMAPTVKRDGKTIPVDEGCGLWTIVSETAGCAQLADFTFNGKVCITEAKPAEIVMVLDASESMDQLLAGAQNALRSLVKTYLQPRPDIPVTITAIGGSGYRGALDDPSKPGCPYARLYGPLAANPDAINDLVDPVFASNNTPIDTALRYSAQFFQDSSKRRVMLVLTDGVETCLGDPALAISQLRDQGIEVWGIKYGDARETGAAALFSAMNTYSTANSQDEITAAMEHVVKDVVEKSCKPILRLYAPGNTGGDALYTLQEGATVTVKRGTYDAVVDYCTGKQVFTDQKIEDTRSFDFTQDCKKK